MEEKDHDVFISYAHIDDQPLVEGEKGWVSSLHRILDIRLGQLLGEAPKIWRDPRLAGNEDFAETLDDAVPRSAVLVSIFTPRYLKSDWCRRELENFLCSEHGGRAAGARSRVFKVVKTPVGLDEQPEEAQKLLGYEFFRRDEASGRVRELRGADDTEYLTILDDLAHDVSETLEQLREQAGAAPGEGAPPTSDDATAVYLATTSSDAASYRDQLARELADRGYRVLPERPLPLVGHECSDAIGRELAGAKLSVHVMGSYYGAIPEGAESSYVQLQFDLGRTRAEAGELKQILWTPPDLGEPEERQRRFLDGAGLEARRGLEVVSTALEGLKSHVLGLLESKPAEAAPASDDDGELLRVYVMCAEEDLDAANRAADVLFEAGLEVDLPLFDGDEAELRELHQERLLECDAVLVVYDAAAPVWVESKLREVRKSVGYGRKRKLAGQGLYVAGEATAHKARLRSREVLIVRDEEGDAAAALAPFAQALRPADSERVAP